MSVEIELSAEMTARKKKRIPFLIRQWITHPLQKELTTHMVAFSLLSLNVIGIALFVAMKFMLRSILEIENLTPIQALHITSNVNNAIIVLSIVLLVSCFLNLAYAAWLSYRISGPLIRLKNSMDAFNPDRVNESLAFRNKDLFPELASSFNVIQQRCKQKMYDPSDTQYSPEGER